MSDENRENELVAMLNGMSKVLSRMEERTATVLCRIAALESKMKNHRHLHNPPDGDTAWETSKPIFEM